MNDYFDALETRSPEEREAQQFLQLREQLRHAKANIPAYADLLQGVDPESITDRSALVKLPVTRKSEMAQAQAKMPPLGGYTDLQGKTLPRVFASPGAIFEPQANTEDFWRTARALHAAGCREGDLVYNTFSYHFTPAGFMLESGAHALGCTVFPAGIGQTELQVQAMGHLRPQFYVGTPSFLKILLAKAKEMQIDVSSLRLGLVSGEALPEPLRLELSENGVEVLQAYATADVGLIGFESESREGLLLDEEILLEIVRPGTGDPVEPGTDELATSPSVTLRLWRRVRRVSPPPPPPPAAVNAAVSASPSSPAPLASVAPTLTLLDLRLALGRDDASEAWQVTVFPAQRPAGREQVGHLRDCLNRMLQAEQQAQVHLQAQEQAGALRPPPP